MQDKTYIIGRKGNIFLADKSASSRHAELVVLNDTMYLTDLNSTNGTFIVDGDELKPFKEGYVSLNQTLSFGRHICSVRELISRAEI
ncbi:MAG: FHA domain-containing protein [Gammaproteobacteria bacterium]|nr:FHA domain-containing protein [Gammaproteobacteria bacterium]